MKKAFKIFLITVGSLIGIFILLAILGSIFVPEEELQEAAQETTFKQDYEKLKETYRELEEARKELKELKKAERELEKAEREKARPKESVKKIFGVAKNDNDSGATSIQYAKPDCGIHYNFSPLGLFLKYEEELGVKLAPKIKKLYEKHGEIEYIVIKVNSPFVDKYGNTTWKLVVHFEFTRDIFNRINWRNFFGQDLLKIAENVIWFRRY